MLSLDHPQWRNLRHAYGSAGDIPAMLKALENYPPYLDWKSEPYFSLNSALCHQGDIYDASFAAVPHFVRILSRDPINAPWALFSIPGAIEQCRLKGSALQIPAELSDSYFSALSELPQIIATAAKAPWDELRCRTLIATIAVVKGQLALSEAIDLLDPKAVDAFLREHS